MWLEDGERERERERERELVTVGVAALRSAAEIRNGHRGSSRYGGWLTDSKDALIYIYISFHEIME